ncbi:MAG TPA: NAD-dependent epimerase/dehydratase family protein [Bryobacteraceae bacterium]|nr:NAD-dependent epimerase/dehydratase family protein [Bryobacteraceae bacterium]
MRKRVFVTGASGFLGTPLVVDLLRRGYAVRALTRRHSNLEGLGDQVGLVEGDIRDRDSLRRGMEGCSTAFHLAAYAKQWAPSPDVFYSHNVLGLRNLLDAAEAASVERVVCTSSVVTFGPTPCGVLGDEMQHRYRSSLTDYEASKTAAEDEALRRAAAGFPVVIVNPTRAYGPGKLTEGNSVSRLIDLYQRGKMPFLLNGGANVGNYAFVDDLVRGHMLAMERGRPGERYILGGENATLKHLFELVDDATGCQHRKIGLPSGAARLWARIQGAGARYAGIYPQITPGWVDTFLADWAFSSAKAERELGYGITPLAEGIRITCDWLRCKQRTGQ